MQILQNGLEGLPDHNILEFLLFYCFPRGDTNLLAHSLIDRFGSFPGVLDATPDELMQVKGVGEITAALLCNLTGIWRAYQLGKLEPGQILDNTERIGAYLQTLFAGRAVETLVMLCLDMKMKLLSHNIVAIGVVDGVAFPVRKMVEIALSQRAATIVIGHNHPGGLALPTPNDQHATEQLLTALTPLGIRLYDHLIICEDDFISLRDSGWFLSIGR